MLENAKDMAELAQKARIQKQKEYNEADLSRRKLLSEKAENLLIQNSSLSKIKIAAAEGKDELVATSYGGDYSGQEDNFYVDDLSIGLLDKHIEFLRTKGFGVLMLGVESGRPTLTISW